MFSRKLLFVGILGLLLASAALVGAQNPRPGEVEIEGVVTSYQGTTMIVGNQTIDVSRATIESGVAAGQEVEVYATRTAAGWTARVVERSGDASPETNQLEIKGTLDQIGDGFIVISGHRIDTRGVNFTTSLVVGQPVEVEYELTRAGAWVIDEVQADDSADDPDGTPTAAPAGNAGGGGIPGGTPSGGDDDGTNDRGGGNDDDGGGDDDGTNDRGGGNDDDEGGDDDGGGGRGGDDEDDD